MPEPTLTRMARWAHGLALADVPKRVQEQAKNQVLSTLGALHAGYASDLGPRIAKAFPHPRGKAKVLPAGGTAPPAHAALLMSTWSMVLDFDDSMVGGHTGHSSVVVPLAYADGHTGADLIRAQLTANEIAARVNTAVALGSLRGQMATHIHLIGAAAARAQLDGLDPDAFGQAVGFALAYPAKALYPGFLGSDAKVMSASWPVRMGLESVDAVRAGLRGNPAILDGRRGFVRSFADVPTPVFLEGLGERWHTETNSFKIYPGCAYISAVIDATLAIVRRFDIAADDVSSVDVHAQVFTIGMDAHSAPYLRGPDSLLPTLSFSTPYNVACAIRDRDLRPEHLTRANMSDPGLWDLARKVRVHHDEALTIEALTADAPVGAALKAAGRDALRYVVRMLGVRPTLPRSLSEGAQRARSAAQATRVARAVTKHATGTAPDLSRSEKAVGARVVLRTTDGRFFEERVRVPLGAAGSADWEGVRELMRAKYLACAEPVVGAAQAKEALAALERLEELSPDEVRELLAANVRPARKGRSRAPSRREGTPPAPGPEGT